MTKSKKSETDQVEDISDTESTISGESFKIRVRKPNKKSRVKEIVNENHNFNLDDPHNFNLDDSHNPIYLEYMPSKQDILEKAKPPESSNCSACPYKNNCKVNSKTESQLHLELEYFYVQLIMGTISPYLLYCSIKYNNRVLLALSIFLMLYSFTNIFLFVNHLECCDS